MDFFGNIIILPMLKNKFQKNGHWNVIEWWYSTSFLFKLF
jgi:hypothetical protein